MACPSGSPEAPRKPAWAWRGLVLAALGAAGAAIPTRFWLGLPDLCVFHRLTGLPCPTCGLTRSWSALLHGHLAEALQYHLLGPAALLGMVLWALPGAGRFPAGWRSRGALVGLALLWAGYSIARGAGWAAGPPGT